MAVTTSARNIISAERRLKALEMRKAGANYREIGQALGIKKQCARRHVKKALDEINRQCAESAAELRQIELERLDRLQRAVWARAVDGDLTAVKTVVDSIMKRRALLLGLDTTKFEFTGDVSSNVVLYLPDNGRDTDD